MIPLAGISGSLTSEQRIYWLSTDFKLRQSPNGHAGMSAWLVARVNKEHEIMHAKTKMKIWDSEE